MEIDCTAFGEIGLETGNDLEVEVLTKQLKLAKSLEKPCIITKKIIEILEKMDFPEVLAVIDHVNSGYYAGLTSLNR